MQEIRIYTTNSCPYCIQAKRFLRGQGLDFMEISLEGQDELRRQLSAENNGWRTVPMIFVGKDFIGGYQDLVALFQSGQLAEKVGITGK